MPDLGNYTVFYFLAAWFLCVRLFKAVGSSRGIAQTERVINYLEQSDMRAASAELVAEAESAKVSLELATDQIVLADDSVS